MTIHHIRVYKTLYNIYGKEVAKKYLYNSSRNMMFYYIQKVRINNNISAILSACFDYNTSPEGWFYWYDITTDLFANHNL